MINNFGEKVNFIWSVADLLRGRYRPNQYKDVMLPYQSLVKIFLARQIEQERAALAAPSKKRTHGYMPNE